MSHDVDAIGEAAHYHHIGERLRYVLNEAIYKLLAVVSGMASAHYGDGMLGIKIARAHRVEQNRGIGGIEQASGKIRIGEITDFYAVSLYKFRFFLRKHKLLLPVVVANDFAFAVGDKLELFFGDVEESFF